jgi:large subunit ribosomal protein L43
VCVFFVFFGIKAQTMACFGERSISNWLESMSRNGIQQLRSLTLLYCKQGGSSRGVREFLEEGLTAFAKANPSVLVSAKLRPGRHPVLRGEYVNGFEKVVPLRNADPETVKLQIERARAQSGHVAKENHHCRVFTHHPSIQGLPEMEIGGIPPL